MPEEKLVNKKVTDIKKLISKDPSVLTENSSLEDLLKEIIKDNRSRHVYVVDKHHKLVGEIRLKNTIQYMFPSIALLQEGKALQVGSYMNYSTASSIKDIMSTSPNYVYENTTLAEMIAIMVKEEVDELPVINKDFEVIGEINFLEIIAYYLKNQDQV